MSRLLLILLLACPASAATVRYALVVGADRGDAQDGPLEYAERDASRVADVLTRMGGVSPENLVLLRAPSADEVRRVLATLDQRTFCASFWRSGKRANALTPHAHALRN